ncbi:MAG: magnesium transporter CorA family protein [Pseudolabrys sp.]|nr:magnesium transporter CorA family protein [Pseudolabrys sp.]MBV9956520.1 magnesium transporter CorA family protein [Pseudolabrys sp.]
MLSVYTHNGSALERRPIESGGEPPDDAIWVDLVSPSVKEDKAVENLLGVAVPTREEMQEIEVSSRLYVENGARYMTATMMCNSDTSTPKTTPVTFILAKGRLVTVRYDDPKPFAIVEHRLGRYCDPEKTSGETVLIDLLDAVIDRCADLLERTGAEVDTISHDIFEPETPTSQYEYKEVLKSLGRSGDLASKIRESLVSMNRLLLFLSTEAETMRWRKDRRAHLQSMRRDAASLSDHATYLSNKITFLLDAMLGVVNIDQNAIIKIFSIAAVVFMPPTLVASIYGMNFKTGMIELEWEYGYIWALALIVLAAIIPLALFKWKKWL